jgi:peptidoglycan/LPS O-acetylase OafA/YrhL/lysophospholipase L1-like esterase
VARASIGTNLEGQRMTARPVPGGDHRAVRLPYVPALDGLRGVAVAAVLLFHAGVVAVPGGHLGVTAFFTLSGFLITSLLLVERHGTGRVDLRGFWARRARRLVPAMLLTFPLVAFAVHLSPTAPADGLIGDAVAAALWIANWRFVVDEQTYADLFAMPSPFQHFWSLAVEEQYYLVFPLLLVLVLGRAARPRTGWLALLLGVLVVASTLQLARLEAAGGGLGRAYYGTDARIAELLVGALLALALVRPDGLRVLGPHARAATSVLGLAGLAGLLAAFGMLDKGDPALYRGGLLAVAVCTAAVLAAAVQPGSLPARLLSVAPLVQLGVISYGVYLFHWPVFLMITEETAQGASPLLLLALRLGVTIALAVLSYGLIELPVRQQGLRLGPGLTAWAGGAAAGVALIAVAAGTLVLPTPTVRPVPGPAGAAALPAQAPVVAPSPVGQAAQPGVVARSRRQPSTGRGSAVAPAPQEPQQQQPARPAAGKRSRVPNAFAEDPKKSTVPPVPEVPPGAVKVLVVGDSIGHNLGTGLRAWAEGRSDVVVYNLAVPACPLSRGGERRLGPRSPFPVDAVCGWWDDRDSERRRALEQFDADVVVVEDGINEVFDRRLPQWSGWRQPGHLEFDRWLQGEYETAFARWGARVLLVNTPCGDWQRYEHFDDVQAPELRVRALNALYSRMPGVELADLFERICPGGRYSDEVEGYPQGRNDGFHFSPEAAEALARNWLGPLALETARSQQAPLGMD